MLITNDLRIEIESLLNTYWESYAKGEWEIPFSLFDENSTLIGSTEQEVYLNYEGILGFFKNTASEIAGKIDLRNRDLHIFPADPHILITEFLDLYILSDEEWIFYASVRVSSILKKTDDGWKLLHQHGSVPDFKANAGETIAFEQITKENIELREAVKKRTAELEHKNRELEVEAALERVRARSIGMVDSSELINVINQLDVELRGLGIDQDGSVLMTDWDKDKLEEGANIWVAVENQNYLKKFHIPFLAGHPINDNYLESRRKNQTFYTESFRKEIKDEYFRYMFKHSELSETPKERRQLVMNATGYTRAVVSQENSGLFIQKYSDEPFSIEQQELIKRFGNVFEQAYTRFLDLKKAEAQAREAQIEAALERVRAASMAMHNSSALQSVVNVIYNQLKLLGIQISSVNFQIFLDDSKDSDVWAATGDSTYKNSILLNYIDFGPTKDIHDNRKLGKSFLSLQYPAEEMHRWWNMAFEQTGFKNIPEERKKLLLKASGWSMAIAWGEFSGIQLNRYNLEEFTQEDHKLLQKFSRAFEQAYVRFLDLKKAESQARETQIELSLERIRTKATAMQKSTDLLDIVVAMRQEFVDLGNEAHYFWHMKWLPEKYEKAMTSGDGSKIGMVMSLPRHIHGDIELVANWEQSDEASLVFPMEVDTAVDYVDKMIALGEFERVDPNAPTLDDVRHIGGLTFIMARTTHGEIGYSLPGFVPNPPTEGVEILTRFAGAFDLAYRRFEDLLVAEQQTYEARIEASLERIRSLASAMNHSDDLEQIAEAMFREMELLKIKPLRYGLAMIEENRKKAELWASTVDDGKYLDLLGSVSLDWHPMLKEGLQAWEKQYEEHLYKLEGAELNAYYERISSVNPNIKNLDALLEPGTDLVQYCSFFPFKTGILYAFTESEPGEDGLSMLKRFANVFEQAHIRYEDLQKTEEQDRLIREERDRLEITLKELRATQAQLIQQEKLASLGQLTAGIAHEIKNPLNFVNNFSDLSLELIEETKEELKKDPADAEEALFILNAVEANLKKIHEHGTRADSIVKSMLQHSRGGTGKMEPTHLNSIIKEYVNLSFHGMRAGKNPINVDIDLSLDDTILEIPLIAEDFSRVILNICNNAFDAMREKLETQNSAEAIYKAKLCVRTYTRNKVVHIEIEDNGSGLSDELKDKILQPFFTTKKGTEGTGLGLSITHDIIKAHGGNLILQSKEGSGTIFTVELPESTSDL